METIFLKITVYGISLIVTYVWRGMRFSSWYFLAVLLYWKLYSCCGKMHYMEWTGIHSTCFDDIWPGPLSWCHVRNRVYIMPVSRARGRDHIPGTFFICISNYLDNEWNHSTTFETPLRPWPRPSHLGKPRTRWKQRRISTCSYLLYFLLLVLTVPLWNICGEYESFLALQGEHLHMPVWSTVRSCTLCFEVLFRSPAGLSSTACKQSLRFITCHHRMTQIRADRHLTSFYDGRLRFCILVSHTRLDPLRTLLCP